MVDEEHEASYKQESLPRYNAREVARARARASGATLLLGSATPRSKLSTPLSSKKSRCLRCLSEIDNRPLPGVALVDMREELRENKSLFSRHLVDHIGARVESGEQVILF